MMKEKHLTTYLVDSVKCVSDGSVVYFYDEDDVRIGPREAIGRIEDVNLEDLAAWITKTMPWVEREEVLTNKEKYAILVSDIATRTTLSRKLQVPESPGDMARMRVFCRGDVGEEIFTALGGAPGEDRLVLKSVMSAKVIDSKNERAIAYIEKFAPYIVRILIAACPYLMRISPISYCAIEIVCDSEVIPDQLLKDYEPRSLGVIYQAGLNILQARNDKELQYALFGDYRKNLTLPLAYNLEEVFRCFAGQKVTIEMVLKVLETVLEMTRGLKDEAERFSSLYEGAALEKYSELSKYSLTSDGRTLLAYHLPIAMSDKDTHMTFQRFLNWCEAYDFRNVFETIYLLTETSDVPYVNTVSSRGGMYAVRQQCWETLEGMAADDIVDEEGRYLLRFKVAVTEDKNQLKQVEKSDYWKNRKPDQKVNGCCVYKITTEDELRRVGEEMDLCVFNDDGYHATFTNGTTDYHLITTDTSQYMLRSVPGAILELRGPSNSKVVKEAFECAQEIVGEEKGNEEE